MDYCREVCQYAADDIAEACEQSCREGFVQEYERWATGALSEISETALCYGSSMYREAHPEVCGASFSPAKGRAMHIDFDHDTAVVSGFVRAGDEHRGPVRMNVYDLWQKGYYVTHEMPTDVRSYVEGRQKDDDRPRVRRLR